MSLAQARQGIFGVPRTRGDGPMTAPSRLGTALGVPRTRGDGPVIQEEPWFSDLVFPAHAGMDRSERRHWRVVERVPRTRGDGPSPPPPYKGKAACSPHTRGWTGGITFGESWDLSVPRTRGDGPEALHDGQGSEGVFPTHAGMDR